MTGGIGSGKTEVGRLFERMGALVIDADVLAREVVAPDTPGFAEVAHRWPQTVRDGVLDRAALAAIVFADARERAALEAIVHPRVRERAGELEAAAGPRLVVHVIPLLYEAGRDADMDATVVVWAPREARLARVALRDGVARDAVERRMAAQIDADEARRRADYTIVNDDGIEALEARTRAVFERLTAKRAQA